MTRKKSENTLGGGGAVTTFNPVLWIHDISSRTPTYLLKTNRYGFFFVCLFDNHLSCVINRVLFTNFLLNYNQSAHLGPTTFLAFLLLFFFLPRI